MKKLIALAVAAACSSTVFAQSVGQWYGEANYQMQTMTDTSSQDLGKFKTSSISLGLGNVVVSNLAIEGFYNLPSTTATNNYGPGESIDVKFKSGYGVAVRPFVNITNDVELYGRLGRVHGESENVGKDNGSVETDTTKITKSFYGAGIAYKISKDVSAVADYKKVTGISGAKVSMTSIGVRYNF